MMSELMILSLVLTMVIQSSSLWTSLLTIPISVLLVKSLSPGMVSNLYVFIFIMIFIGGLLVLLVSVASAVHQEQALSLNFLLLVISLSLLGQFTSFISFDLLDFSSMSSLFSWFAELKWVLMLLTIFILCVSLLVLSSFLMMFKGPIRKL